MDNPEIQKQITEAGKAFNQGKFTHAEAIYLAVLQAERDNFKANLWLGSLYVETRRFEESIPLLETAVILQPENYKPYLSLGLAQSRLKLQWEAIQTFKSAIEKCSMDKLNEAEISYHIAKLSLDLAIYKQAFDFAKRALACKPDYPEADTIRIYCYPRV